MRSVLQNQQLRQLEIVEYLMDRKQITIKQISEDLYISEKTIRKDVKDMNNFLYPAEVITTSRGMYLTLPINYSIEFIYSCFLEQSIEFSIAEDAYLQENLTIDDLSKKYQVSISTIRRSINRLNEQFHKYDFELLSSPLMYKGDEFRITSFLIALNKEKYKMGGSPYRREELDLISELIRRIYKDNNLFLKETTHNNLLSVIMMSATRLKYGHSISGWLDHYIDPQLNLEVIEDEYFVRELSILFNIDLTRETAFELLWTILNEHYQLTYENLLQASVSESVRASISDITKLLTKMQEEFNIPFASKEKTTVDVFNIINITEQEEYILYDPLRQFEKELELDYPRYVETYNRLSEEIFPAGKYSDYQLRNMKYQVFTRWVELTSQLKQIHDRPQVAILMTKAFTHSLFVKHKFEYFYKDRVHFTILEESALTELRSKESSYHILVTNIQGIETKNDMRVMCIPLFPSASDFQHFEQLLTKVKIELNILAENPNQY